MPEKLPLHGVRVIDLATFIAGPFTAAILSEFGAEVIKVEQPGQGDPLRKFGSPSARGDGYAWLSEQRNKKSVTLDLRRPEGAALFKRLVAESDILCENFRPGTMEKWGLGPDELKAVNPGLVLVRISGYGQTGPYRDRPGFARIAHAFGGLTHLTGVPGGPPLTPGSTSLADYISGLYGAVGALLALRSREDAGGQTIDIALYESIFRVLDEMAPLYAATGFVRPRAGADDQQRLPPRAFRVRRRRPGSPSPAPATRCGGAWPPCSAAKSWARTSATPPARSAWRTATMSRPWSPHSRSRCRAIGWWRPCNAGGVPTSPVYSIADIFEDPQYKARGTLKDVIEPETGEHVHVPNVLPAMSGTPGRIESLGPRLGAHNEEVYGGLLGLSAEDRATLREKGVI